METPTGTVASNPEVIAVAIAAANEQPRPRNTPREINLDNALKLAGVGVAILPVNVFCDEAKSKWDKVPRIKDWPNNATADPVQIQMWWKRWPDSLPGIALGLCDLLALDPDRHAGGPDGVAAWEKLCEGKPMPKHPHNTTASGGWHHIFRQPKDGPKFGNSDSNLPGGINVRGVGGFIVAPGSVRSDGAKYGNAGLVQYVKRSLIPEIPAWLADVLRGQGEQPKTNGHAKPNGSTAPHDRPEKGDPPLEDLACVLSALAAIPADIKREPWWKIGAALHHENWTCSREVFDAWSTTAPEKFSAADQEKQWRSFDRPRTGATSTLTTIYAIARDEYGWINPGFVLGMHEDAALDLLNDLAAEHEWIDPAWWDGEAPSTAKQDAPPKDEEVRTEDPSTGSEHVDPPPKDERQQEPRTEEPKQEAPWPTMAAAAYHGLAGDLVRAIEPHTESDPVAILIQTLVCFGNAIGRSAHYRVEASRHYLNTYTVLVGKTARGRKGTSWDRVKELFKEDDNLWTEGRVKSGLSTGEGLIHEVRDEVKKWNEKNQAIETVDDGVEDKRLVVVEAEFAKVLSVMNRQGNSLSPVMRDAWDNGNLSTMTKNSPLTATGAHISVIAHITQEEMRAKVTQTDVANGFLNRFLVICVRRSKLLPFGGDEMSPAVLVQLRMRIAKAVERAKIVGRVTMTPAARTQWASMYPRLTADHPGLSGAVIARAEAHVVRLATLYALLDEGDRIDVVHLEAALALWSYAEASAKRVFGDTLGDPVADEILRALRQAGAAGLTRTDMHAIFNRHQSMARISTALTLLLNSGQARMEIKKVGNRSVETWFAK